MTALVIANLALLSDAPDGVEQLRSLIVGLAVSGRLVPQQPDDEPGADLAVRLRAIKTQATADGARRANALDRPKTPVWPFELPESWTWQVLDDLLWITGGVTLGRKLAGRALVALPYLRVANVQRGYLKLDDLKDIEVPADEVDKYLLRPGDLLITEGGDWDKVGRTAIWRGEIERCLHQNHVFRARPCSDEFLPRWAELYLNSPEARAYFAGSSKQTTNLASINMTQLRSCAFPLPPLAEQHRIVAKVDELMALCDRLEARQQDAEAAHARLVQELLDGLTQARDADEFQVCWQRLAVQFSDLITTDSSIEALKAAVIGLAVEGRLVPQEPGDQDGTALLERLKAAKHAVAKDARKQKEIAVEDLPAVPFDAPSGWAWAHLDQVLIISGGVTLGRKLSGSLTSKVPYLRVANVQRGSLDLSQVKEIEVPSVEVERYRLKAGDLLITEGGDWDKVGRTAVWSEELPLCVHQNHVFRARRCSDELDLRWTELFLNSPVARDYFAGASKQTTNLASINMTQLRSCRIPIPPLAEQRRIVTKVTELLALLDQFKARLAAARAKHAQLAESLVEQALAV